MLKKWTQQELDAQRCDLAGVLDLGTGDFRDCQFYGRSRIVIGAGSMLPDGMQLGESCKIGDGCEIGAGFSCREFCEIGEDCHFGEGAVIGFGSRIKPGTCFATGCEIAREVWIMEGVQLPRECTIYGVPGADGKSMLRVGPIEGRTAYAFRAKGPDGQMRTWAGCTGVETREIRSFTQYVRDRAMRAQFRHTGTDKTWTALDRCAGYFEMHFERSA